MYGYLIIGFITCKVAYCLFSKFGIIDKINSIIKNCNSKVEYYGESMKITYGSNQVVVPYQRNIIPHMSTFKVYAEFDNGRVDGRVDITHQNGVPYMVTGKSMGAKRIIIVDMDDKEYIIDNDKIPSIEFVNDDSNSNSYLYEEDDNPTFE